MQLQSRHPRTRKSHSTEFERESSWEEVKTAKRAPRFGVLLCFVIVVTVLGSIVQGRQGLMSDTLRDSLMMEATAEFTRKSTVLRLIVISDTHGQHRLLSQHHLPPGDVLLHCGDFANKGSVDDAKDFVAWVSSLSQYPEKLVIDGNHDRSLSTASAPPLDLPKMFASTAHPTVQLLQDQSAITRDGLVVHGSSWKSCEQDLFSAVTRDSPRPGTIDVWMVHKHPFVVQHNGTDSGNEWKGSKRISKVTREFEIPLVLSGHVHWGRGVRRVQRRSTGMTHTYVNSASLWPGYVGVGLSPPVVVHYDLAARKVVQVDLMPHPSR